MTQSHRFMLFLALGTLGWSHVWAQQNPAQGNLSNPANPQSQLNPENPRSLNKEMVRQQELERNRLKDGERPSGGSLSEKKTTLAPDRNQAPSGAESSTPTNPRHLITPSPTR